MQIHRIRHTRGFTVMPNTALQDRRLSYTARGLLADLLSRPDGWREDLRRMADSSPQGRMAVAKALRELTAFGYYRVDRVRQADGTIVSQAHVYDTPYASAQVAPGAGMPGPGGPGAENPGSNPVKNLEKEPTLPRQRAAPPPGPPDAARAEAAALLCRVTAPEPRLRLGAREAVTLAPLVVPWLERGLGARDLSHALLAGLPERVHSASALLRDRLTRKLPPPPEAPPPPSPRRYECAACARPIPYEGHCRPCANPAPPEVPPDRTRTATRGRALVRAALAGAMP
ncbi:hypothetical protein HCN08_22180 [Streptomyces sp. PRB2-1]|uniref:Helix-turn-helix domain-containing protein n=2 Tax=Actinacidiphila epipremni TaxID=2053013 RepID=A0ABX0ZTZ8_9ACTN|nr:hypothetical protein [Actinacidiphila epipremni]